MAKFDDTYVLEEEEQAPAPTLDELSELKVPASAYLLTPEQEKHLGRRIKEGDIEARNELVEHNIRLVRNIAKGFGGPGVDPRDVVQFGIEGLLIAAERFDPEKGFRFSTYATWWIRRSISRSMENQSTTIRVPTHLHTTYRKIVKTQRALAQEMGREPTIEEVSKNLKMTEKKVQHVLDSFQPIQSLNQPLGERGNLEMEDSLRGEIHSSPSESFLSLIDDDMQHLCLSIRYGFFDGTPHSQMECARIMRIKPKRVRELERQALEILRRYIA